MPSDVALLNRVDKNADMGRRTCDMFFPKEAKEDTLRVELLVQSSTPKTPPSRPDYSVGSKPRIVRKRKKPLEIREGGRAGSDMDEGGEDVWVKVGDRSMVKRVRNHRIRKPVEDTEDPDAESDCLGSSTEQPRDDRLTPPSAQPSKTQAARSLSGGQKDSRPRPTCDGPAVALMFRKFIEFCNETPSLDNDEASERKCCDNCRPLIIQNLSRLRSELEDWAAKLECIESHTSNGEAVDPSQDHDISPLKQARSRQLPVTVSDSDSDYRKSDISV
jgi:hypothetical protein